MHWRNSSLNMALQVMNGMTSSLLIPSGPSWEMIVFLDEVRRAALCCWDVSEIMFNRAVKVVSNCERGFAYKPFVSV